MWCERRDASGHQDSGSPEKFLMKATKTAGSPGDKEKKMKTQRTSLTLSLAVLLAGAAGIVGIAYAAGTSLSVSFSAPSIVCNGTEGASVTFYYTVTSTGAADAAVVTGQINSGPVFSITTIAAGNVNTGGGWTFSGRDKTFSGTYQTTLANGTYTFTVCATQNGANGNPNKSACNSETVVINCATDALTCANTAPFGEVPHNTNLCSASGQIEIQFRGDFGAAANLEITGPNGFSFSTTVDRAGDSCNYHYNWNPRPAGGTGNGGAGTYTFTATGNNQTPLVWTANLVCQ